MFLENYVNAKNALAEKAQDEQGEIASWMIVAAFLAAAAAAARGPITAFIAEQVNAITSSG